MILDYKRILSFLFPPSEDELQIAGVLPNDFLQLIYVQQHDDVTTLLPYSNARVRSAIHLLKFHNHPHAKKLLATVLHQYLCTSPHTSPILIPIPLSSKRLRERGYNQVTEVIQSALSKEIPATVVKNILVRTRNTTPQTSLSRQERLTNMKDAFAIKNMKNAQKSIAGRHIILIDDVMTTGTTLKAAKTALLSLGAASITCVALAH